MDEATAAIDTQTDALVQATIRDAFAGCTVLTVAHRLDTIADSDRILVMSAGQPVEFDPPALLLSRTDSHYTSLVRSTSDARSGKLNRESDPKKNRKMRKMKATTRVHKEEPEMDNDGSYKKGPDLNPLEKTSKATGIVETNV